MAAATAIGSDAAPAFRLTDLEGNATYTLGQFAGNTVYVDFWASWCVPCRESLPWLAALRQQHDDLVVVAITIDRDLAAAQRFADQWLPKQHNLILLHDDEGTTARAFGVPGMPASFLVNAAGQIVWHHAGFNVDDIPTFNTEPRPPHVSAQYEVWVPREYLTEFYTFAMLNRGSLSIFVHPLGRSKYEDHTSFVQFLGNAYPIDLTGMGDEGDDPQYPELMLGYNAPM